ncbi:sel1 repeat family protein, partial [Chlorobaculum sp. 24CR]|uniref:tetratricopeptide repeat protein n=1 Tax=Chlorobaculum sp. 24CR TaxID=2508878 RepID=UPI0010270BE3
TAQIYEYCWTYISVKSIYFNILYLFRLFRDGLYLKGDTVEKSDTEALKWLRLSAEQGCAEAQHILGLIYKNGREVKRNPTEAVKWFRLAADQGHAPAQFALGVMYGSGDGLKKDFAESDKWVKCAADQGFAPA